MKRSVLLTVLAVLAVAVAVPASIAGAAAPDAQTAAKAKKKAGKKKAGKCKTAKKKGKAKGKGKARKSLAAAGAAAKAKGKKKAKKKCGKAKAKKKAPKRNRARSPYEQKLIEHFRRRAEQRPKPVKPPTIQDMVPADGTYTSATAPGLTVTISGNSTTARVVYTVPKAQYSAQCQNHVTGDGVAVDISGPLTPSQSTKRGYLQLHKSEASNSWSVNGSIGKDGSFTFTVDASFAYPPDPNATCSGYLPLSGTLVK